MLNWDIKLVPNRQITDTDSSPDVGFAQSFRNQTLAMLVRMLLRCRY